MRKSPIFSALCVALISSQLAWSQAAPAALNAEELKQLRQRIAEQEIQIQQLQQAVAQQQGLLERSLAAVQPATAQPMRLVPVAAANSSVNPAAGQHGTTYTPSPLSIKIGNTEFTPLGFVDATFFGRSTNAGSGIGTNFGNIPYNTSASGHISESNFSTQNSRIGFRVDSNVLGAKVLGYFEADFLGNQPANVFVTSNADTFRMRNVFVDVRKNGFEFLGGQDWSLMTPNRKGLSPLPSDIFYTQNMDTNYQAGLVWSRQTQFRFIVHPSENLAFGVSLENPEQYIGGANGSGIATIPAAYSTLAGTQFNNGSGTNYTAPNLHPDIVFKGAYDGHLGAKLMHVEAAGLIRSFKFSHASVAGSGFESSSATAASGEVNANLEIAKNVHLIANTFFGAGNGRYIFAQAPDVVIRADGSISPIHSYSTVDGIEANLTKNTLLYAYYGGIYIGQDVVYDSTAAKPGYVGYGYAGAPSSQNRAIQEGTLGLVHTFWKNPNYGALSVITQYSYLTRNPWSLATGAPKNTHTNMYWIDLRYTLP